MCFVGLCFASLRLRVRGAARFRFCCCLAPLGDGAFHLCFSLGLLASWPPSWTKREGLLAAREGMFQNRESKTEMRGKGGTVTALLVSAMSTDAMR